MEKSKKDVRGRVEGQIISGKLKTFSSINHKKKKPDATYSEENT